LIGLIAAALLAEAGCGGARDGLAREPISGTVTFKGEPLKSGTISFTPIGSQAGVSSGGMISDGTFQVKRADGPIPGKYTVMIFATGARGASKAPGEGSEPAAKVSTAVGLIPIKYNLKSELTAEVKSGGPNSYTFDLQP
jgi:hypothetical protein